MDDYIEAIRQNYGASGAHGDLTFALTRKSQTADWRKSRTFRFTCRLPAIRSHGRFASRTATALRLSALSGTMTRLNLPCRCSKEERGFQQGTDCAMEEDFP